MGAGPGVERGFLVGAYAMLTAIALFTTRRSVLKRAEFFWPKSLSRFGSHRLSTAA